MTEDCATAATKKHAPQAFMFYSIARIALVEMPHLHLQTLGIKNSVALDVAARQTLVAFVRLRETSAAHDEEAEGGKLLWAAEPELEVLKSAEVVILCVLMDQQLNDVFLASSRTIKKQLNATGKMMLQPWIDATVEDLVAVQV
ncbi:hypothetical protein OPT61_g1624 [Boeremia exigua]|uniref:Uncharacterized protein n=1 Tax=Boeremia exigua TaxID=749465 RepID=A0ACC2IPH8_9PLEO|nr:hypothetical protein OPT61_g1624 [Boeremia exigua]